MPLCCTLLVEVHDAKKKVPVKYTASSFPQARLRAFGGMVLQHEVLYAMLGFGGAVVGSHEGALTLAVGLPLLDDSERALVQRLLQLGECYSALERYCSKELLDAEQVDHPTRGAYETAFAMGVEECLQPYRSRVLELEQQLMSTPDLPLPALQLGFGDFELTLPALLRIVDTVEVSHVLLLAVSFNPS